MPITLTQLAGITVLATLPLTLLPALPGQQTLTVAACVALILLRLPWAWAWRSALYVLLFCWAAMHGEGMLKNINRLTAGNIEAQVTIAAVEPQKERLQVQLVSVNGRLQFPLLTAQIYHPGTLKDNLCVGQRWQMTLRLRPVHARLNEGGFDLQRNALANDNPLQGHIISAKPLNKSCSLRARVMLKAQEEMAARPWSGLLMALAFGDRSEVTPAINQLLRETGTAHLMAISGLHIGLAAAAGWLLGRGVQLFLPAVRIGYRLPLISGMLMALGYSWLSGGNPPALRAILALTLWNLLRLAGWHCRGLQVWLICLALLLFTDPLSVLSDSLTLSALAVGGLLVWYQIAPLPGRFSLQRRWAWLRLAHLQLGILLLMFPLQAMLFHGNSLSSFAANLWAVPLVSLVTVPLILLALLLLPLPIIAEPVWFLAQPGAGVLAAAAVADRLDRFFANSLLAVVTGLAAVACLAVYALAHGRGLFTGTGRLITGLAAVRQHAGMAR